MRGGLAHKAISEPMHRVDHLSLLSATQLPDSDTPRQWAGIKAQRADASRSVIACVTAHRIFPTPTHTRQYC